MRKNYVAQHVMKRDDMFYYVRHIPKDLYEHYRVKRLCFSLKTKSLTYAMRAAKSVSQRLDDYWFGIRFKRMDIPAIDSVRKDDSVSNETPNILDALDFYLRLKGQGKDKVFFRTATRNILVTLMNSKKFELLSFIVFNTTVIYFYFLEGSFR